MNKTFDELILEMFEFYNDKFRNPQKYTLGQLETQVSIDYNLYHRGETNCFPDPIKPYPIIYSPSLNIYIPFFWLENIKAGVDFNKRLETIICYAGLYKMYNLTFYAWPGEEPALEEQLEKIPNFNSRIGNTKNSEVRMVRIYLRDSLDSWK